MNWKTFPVYRRPPSRTGTQFCVVPSANQCVQINQSLDKFVRFKSRLRLDLASVFIICFIDLILEYGLRRCVPTVNPVYCLSIVSFSLVMWGLFQGMMRPACPRKISVSRKVRSDRLNFKHFTPTPFCFTDIYCYIPRSVDSQAIVKKCPSVKKSRRPFYILNREG